MPLRSPILWSEALLQPSLSEPSPPSAPPPPTLARPMHVSYSETTLPFASSPELLEQYTNASGGIRTGKLLEHLDSLAGSVSYKHVLGPGGVYDVRQSGFYIVTAAVDR
jgi:acyl-coenzyme A thioesterase 9